MSGLSVERIPAPVRGVDVESAPEYTDTTHGPVVTNFLPGKSGRLVRAGAHERILVPSAVTNRLTGCWPYGVGLLTVANGQATRYQSIGYTGLLSPSIDQTAPGAPILHLLPSYARVRRYVYGVFDPGGGGGYGVAALDSATGSVVASFNAPGPARAVCNFNDRLFVLTDELTSGVQTAVGLRWSDVGGPQPDSAAVWQDDVTGLNNLIMMDGDAADTGVGLARVGRAMVIFRRQSMYLLTGDSPQSYSVQKVSSFGCADPGSILEYNQGVFFLSDEGVCFFNGSTVTVVSRAINDLIPAQSDLVDHARRGNSAARLTQEIVAFSFLSASFMYHVPTGSWTKLDTAGEVGYLARTINGPWFIGGTSKILYDARWVAHLPNTQPDNGATTTIRPNAQVLSKVVRLGTPVAKARLHRLLVDYVATDPAVLTVSLVTEAGTTVFGPKALQSPTTGRARAVFDVFAEVETVQLSFQSTGTRTGIVEIHDTWVEYQAAQHRTG